MFYFERSKIFCSEELNAYLLEGSKNALLIMPTLYESSVISN